MFSTRQLSLFALAISSISGLATASDADFVTQVTPSFRGQPGAEAAGFDLLTQASFLPNFPDLVSCADASLLQLDPAAILTSTGNIYSFGTATSFELDSRHTADVEQVSVQVRTLGTPPDQGSFLLSALDLAGNVVQTYLPDQIVDLDGLGNELQIVWDASMIGAGVRDLRISFAASGSSMSLDVVLLDVLTEREPLSADVPSLSTTSGGDIALELDGGADLAGNLYLLLGTLSGTAPGVTLDGTTLPIVPDAYTTFTIQSAGTGIFQGTLGDLDGCGRASATLQFPSDLPAGLAGSTFHHSFLVVDTVGLSFGVEFASNALTTEITL